MTTNNITTTNGNNCNHGNNSYNDKEKCFNMCKHKMKKQEDIAQRVARDMCFAKEGRINSS